MWGIAALTHMRLESGEFHSRSLSTDSRTPVDSTVRVMAMETHGCGMGTSKHRSVSRYEGTIDANCSQNALSSSAPLSMKQPQSQCSRRSMFRAADGSSLVGGAVQSQSGRRPIQSHPRGGCEVTDLPWGCDRAVVSTQSVLTGRVAVFAECVDEAGGGLRQSPCQ